MDNDTLNQLFLAIPSIEAHEQLFRLKSADFPSMKNEARQKLYKTLNKLANPITIKEETKSITTEELFKILNQG